MFFMRLHSCLGTGSSNAGGVQGSDGKLPSDPDQEPLRVQPARLQSSNPGGAAHAAEPSHRLRKVGAVVGP